MEENKKLENFENQQNVTENDVEQLDKDSEVMEFRNALQDINEEFEREETENEEKEIGDDYSEDIFDEKPEETTQEVDASQNDDNAEETNGDEEVQEVENKDNIPACETEEIEKCDEKVEEPQKDAHDEEYNEYRISKMFTRINYDLTSPSLNGNEIRHRIADGSQYGFSGYTVLSTKVKYLKREIKNGVRICAVVGYDTGEISTNAKVCEIKTAKSQKVAEIAVFMSLSEIKEGIKRNTVREYLKYRKMCGSSTNFKIAVDCTKVTIPELVFAVNCAVEAQANGVILYNYQNAPEIYALRAARICSPKCVVEVTGVKPDGNQLKDLVGKGADMFCLSNAVATAETIKHSEI